MTKKLPATIIVDPEKVQSISNRLDEQEATIEGLGQENTALTWSVVELEKRLDLLVLRVRHATESVKELRNVPLTHLEACIADVVEELVFALDDEAIERGRS